MKLCLSFALALGSLSLFASTLPDEIDYISYGDIYEQKKEVSDAKREIVNGLLSDISYTEGEIRDNQNKVADAQRVIRDSELEIANLERQIENLLNHNQALMKEIRIAERERDELSNRIPSLSHAISSEESSLRREQMQLDSLERELRNKSSLRSSAASDLERSRSKLRSLESKKSQAISSLSNLRSQRNELVKTININESKIPRLRSQISDAKSSLNDPNLTEQQKSRIHSRISSLESSLSSAQSDLNSARSRLPQVESSISRTESEISSYSSQINSAQGDLNRYQNQYDSLDREYNTINARVRQQEDVVRSVRSNIRRLENELSNARSRKQSLESLIYRNQNQIAENQRVRDNNRAQINSLKDFINQNHQYIANLRSLISDLQYQLRNLQSDCAIAEDIAQTAESATAYALREYEARESLYDNYLAEAKSVAAAQAIASANTSGSDAGASLGLFEGEQNGYAIGEQTGLVDGLYRGLLRGKLKGNVEGYQEGNTSEASFEEGRAAGILVGKQNARNTAMSEDYPRAFRLRKAEILDTEVPMGNTLKKSLLMMADVDNAIEELWLVAGEDEFSLTPEEREAALNIESQVDDYVQTIAQRLKFLLSIQGNLSRPQDVHRTPQGYNVLLGDRDCSFAYKQVEDFIDACEDSYVRSFHSNYQRSHYSAYAEAYVPAYESKKMPRFQEVKNDLFAEGYQKSYDIVFFEAKARGLKDSRQRGYNQGLGEGYNAVIDQERERAFGLGQEAAEEFIRTHAVVRLASNSLSLTSSSPVGFVKDGMMDLNIALKNFGGVAGKASNGKIKILSFSNNLSLLAKEESLIPVVEENSLNVFSGMTQFKISNAAQPGDRFFIEVLGTFDDNDNIAGIATQKQIIEGVILANPELKIEVKYDKYTRAKRFLSKKGNVESVKVKLWGKSSDALDGQGYEIELVELTDGLVSIMDGHFSVPLLKKGEKFKGKLKYRINPKAKKVGISLELRVKYKGMIIQRKPLQIKTK